MPGVIKMGFEGKIYYGVAGAEGTTPITNSRDVTFSIDPEKAETTVRGTGAAPPIKTEAVVGVAVSMEWTMLNKTDDTTLTALRTAAAVGNPVAFRMKDSSAGKGFDGDVTLSMSEGHPYKGESTFQFTATPTVNTSTGRAPQTYV